MNSKKKSVNSVNSKNAEPINDKFISLDLKEKVEFAIEQIRLHTYSVQTEIIQETIACDKEILAEFQRITTKIGMEKHNAWTSAMALYIYKYTENKR